MSDALVIMTSKSWGCLGVVDTEGCLVGIITDGDLRRHMSTNIIEKTTSDIMTRNPQTVVSDILCVEALRIMNTKKVTSLFVVDGENKPIGLLHVHPLLMAGVA